MNVVMTGSGKFVEVQGTGEESPFSRKELDELLLLAELGIQSMISEQEKVLGVISERIRGLPMLLPGSEILIATKNAGKVKEFESLFRDKGLTVRSLRDYPDIPDIPEDGETFAANALIKARAIALRFGVAVAADDSGLCVDRWTALPECIPRVTPESRRMMRRTTASCWMNWVSAQRLLKAPRRAGLYISARPGSCAP